jgi:2-polyprenyl-6-methoxyphenol hydroxylase-like FAD-dependent oxidoreductase
MGQNTLSTLIKSARKKGMDIGDSTLLEKYHTHHHRACRPLYLGTNAIVRLFTNDTFVPKIVRKIALRVGNNFYPLKRIITKHLTQIKSTVNQRAFK